VGFIECRLVQVAHVAKYAGTELAMFVPYEDEAPPRVVVRSPAALFEPAANFLCAFDSCLLARRERGLLGRYAKPLFERPYPGVEIAHLALQVLAHRPQALQFANILGLLPGTCGRWSSRWHLSLRL